MFDSILGWRFGIAASAVGLLAALAAGRAIGVDSSSGRNVEIDGLRGDLAFGVLLHHGTAVGVVAVAAAALSYQFIEWPAMRGGRRATAWIRTIRSRTGGFGFVGSSKAS